jgi:hypothetical protein
MSKNYVEKDGWTVDFSYGGTIEWVEANPTYSKECPTCRGSGKVSDNNCGKDYHNGIGIGCDCVKRCPENCRLIHGRYMEKDEPEHPMPSSALLSKIADRLRIEMNKIGKEIESGDLEKELAEEQAREVALRSASL